MNTHTLAQTMNHWPFSCNSTYKIHILQTHTIARYAELTLCCVGTYNYILFPLIGNGCKSLFLYIHHRHKHSRAYAHTHTLTTHIRGGGIRATSATTATTAHARESRSIFIRLRIVICNLVHRTRSISMCVCVCVWLCLCVMLSLLRVCVVPSAQVRRAVRDRFQDSTDDSVASAE